VAIQEPCHRRRHIFTWAAMFQKRRVSARTPEYPCLHRPVLSSRYDYERKECSSRKPSSSFGSPCARSGTQARYSGSPPGDVAFWGGELLIRPRSGAEDHAKHVFDRAQERGFGVSIQAIAQLDQSICCLVFAPDDTEDRTRSFVAPQLPMK
jgi:hypothetical protein